MSDLKRLFREVVSLEIELWNGIDARLRAECDLPLTSFEVLRFLLEREGQRVQDVADEFSITVGGASKVVDRLETTGMVVRRANPSDRRSSIVELTPQGHTLTTSAMAIFERELELRIGNVISERSVRQLTTTLARLRDAGRVVDSER